MIIIRSRCSVKTFIDEFAFLTPKAWDSAFLFQHYNPIADFAHFRFGTPHPAHLPPSPTSLLPNASNYRSVLLLFDSWLLGFLRFLVTCPNCVASWIWRQNLRTLSLLNLYFWVILIKPITKHNEKDILKFYALALHNNFDLCLSIFI